MVDESIEIFFPIFQFGCLSANFGLMFEICLFVLFKNGPPDAVNIILLISVLFSYLIKLNIE